VAAGSARLLAVAMCSGAWCFVEVWQQCDAGVSTNHELGSVQFWSLKSAVNAADTATLSCRSSRTTNPGPPAPIHHGSASLTSPHIGHHLVGHQLAVPLPAAAVLRSAPLVVPEGAVLQQARDDMSGHMLRRVHMGVQRLVQPNCTAETLTRLLHTGCFKPPTAGAGRRLTVSSRVRKTT
jgi:hypothetical protein